MCRKVNERPQNLSVWQKKRKIYLNYVLLNIILFYYRFLELESSGRRDELRLHYTHDQQIRVETFPFRLADNRWHKLALTLSGNHVTLYINCSKIYERVILSLDKRYLAGNYLNLYIGQRNSQSAHFRVSSVC